MSDADDAGASAGACRLPADKSAGEAARADVVRKLFEDHNNALISFLAARLHSRAEARDVAQEAYVRMLQLERPEAIGFLRAYLFRTASNIAIDRIRRRTVRETGLPQALFEELLVCPEPDRVVLAEQELQIIKSALRELPDKCRRAFVSYMFGEQSVSSIAAMMGMTERMIRNYIAHALTHCRCRRDGGARQLAEGKAKSSSDVPELSPALSFSRRVKKQGGS